MRWNGILFVLATLASAVACSFQSELTEKKAPDKEKTGKAPIVLQPKPAPRPSEAPGRRQCDAYESFDQELYVCYASDSATYLTDCDLGLCKEVPVHVTYMLSEDLGLGHTVVVEAFDNHLFKGNPVALVRMTNFDATRPGRSVEDVMLLAPGEYFFRAYLATNEEPFVPYQYGDMELVSDQPFGLFGALSEVAKVTVDDTPALQRPISVFLDKLFKHPEADPPSKAHIRTILTLDSGLTAPLGQKVWIQLHKHEDFSFHPAYRFSIPSESLRTSGQEGRAEYISDHLDPGEYFVFVYLDASGNGFYDRGEPWQVFQRYGEQGLVHVEGDKTVTIELVLSTANDFEQ